MNTIFGAPSEALQRTLKPSIGCDAQRIVLEYDEDSARMLFSNQREPNARGCGERVVKVAVSSLLHFTITGAALLSEKWDSFLTDALYTDTYWPMWRSLCAPMAFTLYVSRNAEIDGSDSSSIRKETGDGRPLRSRRLDLVPSAFVFHACLVHDTHELGVCR
jgi:hypothetical protein